MSPERVDVIINALGKPYQTAVTLFTLMRHCAAHIDRTFLILEKVQPLGRGHAQFEFIGRLLPNLVMYVPREFLFCWPADVTQLGDEGYRRSIHYQYGFE